MSVPSEIRDSLHLSKNTTEVATKAKPGIRTIVMEYKMILQKQQNYKYYIKNLHLKYTFSSI